MKIGITGANGFIGSHLTEQLISEGHQVTCLVRESSSLRWIEHLPVMYVYGDVLNKKSLPRFVEGKDLIFHLAGMVKARSEEEIIQANAGGTENIAEAVTQYAPDCRRLLAVSSQEVVGLVDTLEPYSEDIALRPITSYGKSKALAEQILREKFPNLPWTIIRPSSVFGPRDTDIFIFFKLVQRGLVIAPGVDSRFNLIYVKNLVRGMILAALSPAAAGEVYFFTDDGHYTWIDLADKISSVLEKHPFRLDLPVWFIRTIGGVSKMYTSVTGRATILNKEKLLMMTQPNLTASNRKSIEDFGYCTEVPLEKALAETAAWYFENGWLK